MQKYWKTNTSAKYINIGGGSDFATYNRSIYEASKPAIDKN